MLQQTEDGSPMFLSEPSENGKSVVVAGPSSSLTVPGLIVAEIVAALEKLALVTRIDVDLGDHPTVGLHRVPSLAAAHGPSGHSNVLRRQAPRSPRARKFVFRDLIGPDTRLAIAYAWPGLENGWIRQFVDVARTAGVRTAVVCASLPETNGNRVATLATAVSDADVVIVGSGSDADELLAVLGTRGPRIEIHPALSLRGRNTHTAQRVITAFVPKENRDALSILTAAFDAIPSARIDAYRLQVVMRYSGGQVPSIVANSYHSKYVDLYGDDMSTQDLQTLFHGSSALGMSDPEVDSRAFATAIECGIATVVLADSSRPVVGRGYVGGLLANRSQPASVHVALLRALRLSELGFPSPDVWGKLAGRLVDSRGTDDFARAAARERKNSFDFPSRVLESIRFSESTT